MRSLGSTHLIVLGVVIRLALIPFFAHPYDMYAWYSYVEGILKQGISLSIFGINPLWNFLLILIAYIYDWLSNILHISVIPVSILPSNFDPSYGITVVTDTVFNTLVKIPLIVADILSAFLIYRIAYFYTRDYFVSRRPAFLYFFSPIVIWISAAWGQYDSLAVLFTLLSFYLLLVSKRMVMSALSLYVAVLIKIYPIIFLVPILLSILRFDKARRWKVASFLFFLIPVGLYLLFFQEGAFFSFLKSLILPSGLLFTSGFGLTYWSVSLIMPIDIFWSRLIMNLVMLSLVLLSLYYVIRRAKTRFDVVVLGSFLFTAALFLSLTIVTEQRSLILLALLSLAIIYRPSPRIYLIFLSFAAFLYAQKNFPFYLLPLASRFPDSFSFLFSYASPYVVRSSEFLAPTFSSGLFLFIVGSSFSGILLVLFYKVFRMNYSLNN